MVGGGKDREEMRLIDADALIKAIQQHMVKINSLFEEEKTVVEIIKEQHTAFDTEKVVEQLEGLSNAEADYYYAKSNDVIDREDAIDIVKKGGVE